MTSDRFAESLTRTPADRLAFASARIRRYCGWHIWPSRTETLTLDTHGGRVLLLPTVELSAVGTVAFTADETVLDPGTYRKSRLGMVELLTRDWPVGFETVRIQFTHGYEDIPEELVEVAAGIAKRAPSAQAGVTQEVVDRVSITYGADLAGGISSASGLTIAETTILDQFRVRGRA